MAYVLCVSSPIERFFLLSRLMGTYILKVPKG